jgi:hypothetical protein
VPTGASAAVTLAFSGSTASNTGQEVDLTIDPAGDLLAVDPAGDVLAVTLGITWTGVTAAETLA